jgi:hypothetical protein
MVEFRTGQRGGSADVTQQAESALVVGAVTTIAASTLTTVATFTATALVQNVTKISCSGQESAKWELFIDTVLFDTKRSGPELNAEFRWDKRFNMSTGSVLDVKVTHEITGETPNFEATIYGF